LKIIIGFSRPKKWFKPFSWIIRALYNTEYSHVYVRWRSVGADADVAYEASGTSVHFTCKQVFEERTLCLHEYEIDITKEQYKKLLHYCMTHAGVDYGLKQAFGIALVEIFNLNKNPYSDGRMSQVCSEVVMHVLEEVVGAETGLDFDTASPKDIKRFLDCCSEIARKIL
jgi:SHS2 domain-containing protein